MTFAHYHHTLAHQLRWPCRIPRDRGHCDRRKLYKHELVTVGAATAEAFRDFELISAFWGLAACIRGRISTLDLERGLCEACYDRERGGVVALDVS